MKRFIPQQGVRQGDPFSPYIFIFCAIVLSCMLMQAELQGPIKGVRACRNTLRINHFMFVNDLIFFYKIDGQSV